MKKLISVMLVLLLSLSLASCSLFSSDSVLKLGDYTYNDPKDLKYDNRVVLCNDDFGATLADYYNASAYPDTLVYGDDGSIIGMYNYDPETGLAVGWTDLSTGTYTEYEAGNEVNLGMPDESLMISIAGKVSLYFVVYDKDSIANDAWMYVMLGDAADKDNVITAMDGVFGIALTAESDTVLKSEITADSITATFDDMESFGDKVDSRDAKAYATVLKQNYGVSEYGESASAYTPYAGHEDPADLDYDQRVVLVGSAEMAVDEGYTQDVSLMTTYVYGKNGDTVAVYTYYECPSKDAADELMTVADQFFFNPVRFSDTVIQASLTGDEMQEALSQYIGYTVLADKSVDEYVRMIKETYYSVVCD